MMLLNFCGQILSRSRSLTSSQRAEWRSGFSQHNLKSGEAFIGDYENYGMSERSYRTAKLHLAKWSFTTFKATNKGTVAKLMDTRLFEVMTTTGDGQNADNRRTGDGQYDEDSDD